jgi:hypothetical protein
MEIFNTHRRDILNFDSYMDLKKPGFGGPSSAIALRDERGKKINKDPKLAGYQRTVERDPAFSNPVYNSTYKAMTHDLVYKQENKKPFTYTDPYRTAVPVIEYDPTSEGKSYESFKQFVNEERSLSEIEAELRSYETGANPAKSKDDDLEMMAAGLPEEFGKPSKEDLEWLKSIKAGSNPSDEYFDYGYNPDDEDGEYFEECPECGGRGCDFCDDEGSIPLRDTGDNVMYSDEEWEYRPEDFEDESEGWNY